MSTTLHHQTALRSLATHFVRQGAPGLLVSDVLGINRHFVRRLARELGAPWSPRTTSEARSADIATAMRCGICVLTALNFVRQGAQIDARGFLSALLASLYLCEAMMPGWGSAEEFLRCYAAMSRGEGRIALCPVCDVEFVLWDGEVAGGTDRCARCEDTYRVEEIAA